MARLSDPDIASIQRTQAGGEAGDYSLRILATSDLHVHITPWDYFADHSSVISGLARTATLIAAARAEVATSLLVDNGDFLNGSPMGDYMALEAQRLTPHPMIAAMNALGYDAATLGNHEFSSGLDFLMHHIAAAQFPFVSANIGWSLGAKPEEDRTLVPPFTIVTRKVTNDLGQTQTLRIGIIGLVPPQTTQWDHQQLGDRVATRDIIEAATAHVPRLRAAGADIVLALSHSGIGHTVPSPFMENATAALATVPGIDALIAGHTHQCFPSSDFQAEPGIDPVLGRLWGKPAMMPGFYGSHLGVMDLRLHLCGTTWRVADSQIALRAIAKRTRTGRVVPLARTTPLISNSAKAAHQATRRWATTPLGHTEHPLHSYFALVAPSPTVRLVAQAQRVHVTQALAGGPYADLPVISAAAPFHAGGRGGPENYTTIAPGPLVMRHAFDLYPHPNTIAALVVTGAELALWLERSFSLFHTLQPQTQDAPLINLDFPSFNFDLLEGVTWTADLSAAPHFDSRGNVINPDSRRITDLCHDGRPVDPAARFVLATNSYRAAGSGGFPGAAADRMILSGPAFSRDILRDFIERSRPLPCFGRPNWRFAPMPGTTALFDSAPEADRFVSDLSALQAEALDLTPTGFRRFRLHL